MLSINLYEAIFYTFNTYGLEPFPEAQMKSVKDLILYLIKRFEIRKDMIFSHAEIGTILYNPGLESYVMRKPDPHKLFDWEFLEKNEIGLHIGDRIKPEDAKQLMSEVLYEVGDKKVIFHDNNADYSDEFDENFSWIINQFSMHHLPKEIRKNLPLKLEREDILPDFLREYGNCVSSEFLALSDKIKLSLQPPFLNEADYKCLLSSLTQYEDRVSSDAFATLMYKIKLYYDSYLRYHIGSLLYTPFKINALAKLNVLKNEVLSL